ncbi:hypothetical protein ACIQEY_29380 [Streptomyces parvus]|uniref:hypothetical protein n=1 Tax=Streptomyces parvus TaxID=66428 RepID=UPI0037FB4630
MLSAGPFRTDTIPRSERFAYRHTYMADVVAPREFSSPHAAGFGAGYRLPRIEDAVLWPTQAPASRCRRTPG